MKITPKTHLGKSAPAWMHERRDRAREQMQTRAQYAHERELAEIQGTAQAREAHRLANKKNPWKIAKNVIFFVPKTIFFLVRRIAIVGVAGAAAMTVGVAGISFMSAYSDLDNNPPPDSENSATYLLDKTRENMTAVNAKYQLTCKAGAVIELGIGTTISLLGMGLDKATELRDDYNEGGIEGVISDFDAGFIANGTASDIPDPDIGPSKSPGFLGNEDIQLPLAGIFRECQPLDNVDNPSQEEFIQPFSPEILDHG